MIPKTYYKTELDYQYTHFGKDGKSTSTILFKLQYTSPFSEEGDEAWTLNRALY